MMKYNYSYSPLLFLVLLFGVSLHSCQKRIHLADVTEQKYEVGSNDFEEDTEILDYIAPYKVQLDSLMDIPIGYNAQTLYKARPEGTLNHWLADLLHEEAEKIYGKPIDFAAQNYGGIRVPTLAQGVITVRDAYEIMPFDNELVVLEAKGEIVEALFRRIAEKGGWPISKQVYFVGKEDGSIIDLKFNGEAFDVNKTYTFALNDYIANGGDRCDFLINQSRTSLQVKVRDAIIDHLKSTPIEVEEVVVKDGRIRILKEE